MTDRAQTARQAAQGLRRFRDRRTAVQAMIGFDGFVDSIIKVVAKRHSSSSYDAVETIADFGNSIVAAAGQSSNFELVTTLRKLGGNGPIMANALAAAGVQVTYIGALGHPELNPVFTDFAQMAEVHSVAEPGYTDALEFDDGKLMLGKHESIVTLDMDAVDAHLGRDRFGEIVERSRLVGMVNWTMLLRMETIWEVMLDHVLPGIEAEAPCAPGQPRIVFVDLADPAKRSDADIRRAMGLLTKMSGFAAVVLGMNLAESRRVASVLGVAPPEDVDEQVRGAAEAVREKLGIHGVVIHPRRGAGAAVRGADGKVESAFVLGPFVKHPRLSTGAGDNFNAGFCLGLLAELPVDQALCAGVGTSGFYVREARSPSVDELADFCDELPAGE